MTIPPENSQPKSNWLMLGYYREPALTNKVHQDGWLATGDVGGLDADGYLRITGRVKEKYKSPKGEYIAPAQIELGFATNSYIEQIYVCGYHLPQPVALIVPSEMVKQADRQLVSQSLEQTLKQANLRLYPYEHVRKVIIVKDAWSVDNNRITPTMKVKRSVVETHYAPQMEDWFTQSATVVWEE